MPAELVEYYGPGAKLPMTVGGTAVQSGQVVALSAGRTVIPAAANSKTAIGVALYDGAIGSRVSVATQGVWPLTNGSGSTITAGSRVICAASGAIQSAVDPGGTYVEADAEGFLKTIGIALEDIAAAGTGRVLLTIG